MARSPKKLAKQHPMFLNPCGKFADFEFGVLRSSYQSKPNSVLQFVTAKLTRHERADVLLPDGVPDSFRDHARLWAHFEEAQVPGQRDLASVVCNYLPSSPTLHSGWEVVRAWALEEFARRRGLPVSLIMHVPAHAGSPNDPHIHAVVAGRVLHPWGWGAFSSLVRDPAQIELHASWQTHRAAWSTARSG